MAQMLLNISARITTNMLLKSRCNMQDANKLNRLIYTHDHNHTNSLCNAVSRIVVNKYSRFNQRELKTILAECRQAEIVQK